MKRLKDIDRLSYDSMIIIYYCFKIKNNQLIELSDKSHRLTEFLVKNNTIINVPSFLISEIKRKDAIRMIDDFINSRQIANTPRNVTLTFKLGLEFKFKSKLNKLMKKEWFVVEDYTPSDELYGNIENFFKDCINDSRCEEFLKRKKRDTPVPSFEDIGLMAFSKENQCPIISNDNDLTFFMEELVKKELVCEIFNFNDLDTYNN